MKEREMKQDKDLEKDGMQLAELSCLIAQTCNEKENYFASQFGITPTEFKCLRLFVISDNLPIKEIASHLPITAGRITHILTSLEKKGFITREADPNDRRNIIVSLTAKAGPLISELDKSHLQLHIDILKNLPKEKRNNLIGAIKELIEILKPYT